jgi:predicted ester cyclase
METGKIMNNNLMPIHMKTSRNRFISSILFASLLFVSTGCQNQSEKTELNKLKATVKIQDQNKETVRQLFTAIDNQNFDKLNELFSDDFSLSAEGLDKPWKKEDVFQDIKRYYTSFPDWHHEIKDMIAEGDKVAIKIMQTGTQKAQFEEIAPKNTKVTKSAMHVVTIVNGKIKEWWAIENDLGLMLQLGMVLKPKEEKR